MRDGFKCDGKSAKNRVLIPGYGSQDTEIDIEIGLKIMGIDIPIKLQEVTLVPNLKAHFSS